MADNQFSVRVPSLNEAFASGEEGYSALRKLMETQKLDRAFEDASAAIKSGDNMGLMDALLRARQIGPAIEVAKLGRQQESSDRFSKDMGSIFGQPQQGAVPPQQTQPGTAPSPVARLMTPEGVAAPPRAPVQSSPTTWGDAEGVKAGIYDPPTGSTATPAAPPVQAQAQPARTAQVGPSPSLGGVSLDKAVPSLLRAASDPSLPKEQQETARMLLGKAFDQYPTEIRQLEIFKQRPDLFQMAKDLKTAGATVINTAEGQQAAETKARIDIDQHAVKDLSVKVASGRSALPLLTQMMAINDKTPGGWAGTAAPYLAKAAATLGVNVPEGASNAELFNAMSRQFIPSVRDPGATSNYEQNLYASAVPSLSQSPEGRAKIAGMMKSQIERNAEILATYRRFVGRPELDAKLSELDNKPLFSEADRKALEAAVPQQAPPAQAPRGGAPKLQQFNSPQDVARSGLKSGSRFLDSNGVERIVP